MQPKPMSVSQKTGPFHSSNLIMNTDLKSHKTRTVHIFTV
jgi:hypothetical protein